MGNIIKTNFEEANKIPKGQEYNITLEKVKKMVKFHNENLYNPKEEKEEIDIYISTTQPSNYFLLFLCKISKFYKF